MLVVLSWVGPLLRVELSLGTFCGGVDKSRELDLLTESPCNLQFLHFRTSLSWLLSYKISPITELSSLLDWSWNTPVVLGIKMIS